MPCVESLAEDFRGGGALKPRTQSWGSPVMRTMAAGMAAGALAAAALARQETAPAPGNSTAPSGAPSPAPSPAPQRSIVEYTNALRAGIDPARLGAFHVLLGSEPHIAGTPGDARQIERLAQAFTEMGLKTRIEPFWALLPHPIEAKLEIVNAIVEVSDAPGSGVAAPAETARPGSTRPATPAPSGSSGPPRRGIIPLPIRESNLAEDPATAHPDLTYGWNAYSGSGDVTAGVVFAHRGTRDDFARLRELGVDCTGKIVLIRYGGIFRGSKVRNAQEAGAAGVLLYTDPADSGANKGPVWPEGGWANDLCIQRGCVATLDWPGDPLTPLVPASPDAPRLDPDKIALPRIPVQPIGYAAATQIMSRMTGREVPDGDPWRGGIAVPYRYEGGPDLELRLQVRQDREIRESANVIGVLQGSVHPDEVIIVGCHHDAWCFGAADPLAGTICLMETARVFAERAKAGERPERTIIFAAWGAEEYGMVGSVEWVEAHREAVAAQCVAYLNLDMAAMGPRLGGSSSPSLRAVVSRATGLERVGDIGGGSDHVGFIHHLSVPSIGLGAHGGAGDSYHSNYDTVEWYRRTIGADYASAKLVTDATVAIVAALAREPLLPIRTAEVGRSLARWSKALLEKSKDDPRPRVEASLTALVLRGEAMEELGARIDARLDELAARLARGPDSSSATIPLPTAARVQRVNHHLMALERAWYDAAGLPSRSWSRNLALSSDREGGYGVLVLPLIAEALQEDDAKGLELAFDRTGDATDRVSAEMQALDDALDTLHDE